MFFQQIVRHLGGLHPFDRSRLPGDAPGLLLSSRRDHHSERFLSLRPFHKPLLKISADMKIGSIAVQFITARRDEFHQVRIKPRRDAMV
jgi:hypothetical protein